MEWPRNNTPRYGGSGGTPREAPLSSASSRFTSTRSPANTAPLGRSPAMSTMSSNFGSPGGGGGSIFNSPGSSSSPGSPFSKKDGNKTAGNSASGDAKAEEVGLIDNVGRRQLIAASFTILQAIKIAALFPMGPLPHWSVLSKLLLFTFIDLAFLISVRRSSIPFLQFNSRFFVVLLVLVAAFNSMLFVATSSVRETSLFSRLERVSRSPSSTVMNVPKKVEQKQGGRKVSVSQDDEDEYIKGSLTLNLLPVPKAELNPDRLPFCLTLRNPVPPPVADMCPARTGTEIGLAWPFQLDEAHSNEDPSSKMPFSKLINRHGKLAQQAAMPLSEAAYDSIEIPIYLEGHGPWQVTLLHYPDGLAHPSSQIGARNITLTVPKKNNNRIPIKLPGVYSLLHVDDLGGGTGSGSAATSSRIDVNPFPMEVFPCPELRLLQSGRVMRCIGDSLDLDMALYSKNYPVSLVYTKTRSHGGTTPKPAVVETSVFGRAWTHYRLEHVVREPGEYAYRLVGITDQHNHSRSYPQDSQRSFFVSVPPVPEARLMCSPARPIIARDGADVALPLRLQGNGPWTVTYEHTANSVSPSTTTTTTASSSSSSSTSSSSSSSSSSVTAPATRRFSVVHHSENDQLMVSEPGSYSIVSVQDHYCRGRVITPPSYCRVKAVARPTIAVDAAPNQDGCHFWKGCFSQDFGLYLRVRLTGEGPWRLRYEVIKEGDRKNPSPRREERIHHFSAAHDAMMLVPGAAGTYLYIFKSLTDEQYDDIPVLNPPCIKVTALRPPEGVLVKQTVTTCVNTTSHLHLQWTQGETPMNVTLRARKSRTGNYKDDSKNKGKDNMDARGNGNQFQKGTHSGKSVHQGNAHNNNNNNERENDDYIDHDHDDNYDEENETYDQQHLVKDVESGGESSFITESDRVPESELIHFTNVVHSIETDIFTSEGLHSFALLEATDANNCSTRFRGVFSAFIDVVDHRPTAALLCPDEASGAEPLSLGLSRQVSLPILAVGKESWHFELEAVEDDHGEEHGSSSSVGSGSKKTTVLTYDNVEDPKAGLVVTEPGLYRLVAARDMYCNAVVASDRVCRVKPLSPRPTIVMRALETPVRCETSDVGYFRVAANLTGRGPWTLKAEKVFVPLESTTSSTSASSSGDRSERAERGERSVEWWSSTVSGEVEFVVGTAGALSADNIVIPLNYSMPGHYEFRFTDMGDGFYPVAPMAEKLKFSFSVSSLPRVRFAQPHLVTHLCATPSSSSSSSPSSKAASTNTNINSNSNKWLPLPIVAVNSVDDMEVTIEASSEDSAPVLFTVPVRKGRAEGFELAQPLRHPGEYQYRIVSVRQENTGCMREVRSQLATAYVHPLPGLSIYNNKNSASSSSSSSSSSSNNQDYICVGQEFEVRLSGEGPWNISCTLGDKSFRIRTEQPHFSYLAHEAGMLRMTAIHGRYCSADLTIPTAPKSSSSSSSSSTASASAASTSSQQVTTVPPSMLIRGIPTARVNDGANMVDSILEGDASRMDIRLTGTPPFAFVYRREVDGMVEEHNIKDHPDFFYSRIVDMRGEYRVVEVRDQFCRYSILEPLRLKSRMENRPYIEEH